jgi:hypothetical protein
VTNGAVAKTEATRCWATQAQRISLARFGE